MTPARHPRIVVLGGGTGTFTILSGLRKHPVTLTAIVSTADSGGSTGTLRNQLCVLPPGDVRQCLVALSHGDSALQKLFTYRFTEGSFAGHSFGNLFLSALECVTGDPLSAVREAERILDVRGNVIPVSAVASNLCAELEDGSFLSGEHIIDESHVVRAPIKRCFLHPRVQANPEAIAAIEAADLIILGPGDLYTSIVPVLLVDGVAEALARSTAKLVYVLNLVTKRGQTDGYTGTDFVERIRHYIHPTTLHAVLVNNAPLPRTIMERYESLGGYVVQDDLRSPRDMHVYREDLLAHEEVRIVPGDSLPRSLIRHDPDRLAQAILHHLL